MQFCEFPHALMRFVFAGVFTIEFGMSSAYGSSVRGGDCVWKHLPENTQSAALRAGMVGGPASMMSQVPKDEISEAERVCGVNDSNMSAYHRSEAGYMLQILSENWLMQNANISDKTLDEAWSRVGSTIKDSAKNWAVYLIIDPAERDRIFLEFMKRIGVHTQFEASRIKPQVLTYIQGRALRDAYDPEL